MRCGGQEQRVTTQRPMVRQLLRVLWDWASWIAATSVVVGSRYDFRLQGIQWSAVVQYAVAACIMQLMVGTLLMLYRGRYKTASFEESLGLALSAVIVAG